MDPNSPSASPEDEEVLRRLIRLAVGVILVGQDALQKYLPLWEAEARQILDELEKKSPSSTETQTEASAPATLTNAPWFPKGWEYRLIGLAFESPNYLRMAYKQLSRAPQSAWRATAPLRRPLDWLGVSDFTRNWLNGASERLKTDLERLEEIGRSESAPSRALGQAAVMESFDRFLQRLAENPEVQELVQTQTSGLTTEFVDEIRERTVSADTFVEAFLRRLLKQPIRPPQKMEPTPPETGKREERW
ncbi:MAG: hypothetical protein MUE67_05795 [Anaerolineales bacterium]|jgi:hypothetical protein|nr:hypothetical protein [Anaerolineales bacterium]